MGQLGKEGSDVGGRMGAHELQRQGAHTCEVGLARDLLDGVGRRVGVIAELRR